MDRATLTSALAKLPGIRAEGTSFVTQNDQTLSLYVGNGQNGLVIGDVVRVDVDAVLVTATTTNHTVYVAAADAVQALSTRKPGGESGRRTGFE